MSPPDPQIDLEKCVGAATTCACFNFRKASRAVTQLFDDALQPTGLRSTQLVILIAAAVFDSLAVSRLARELVMDRSTLTRNLRPLERRGLLRLAPGKDVRTRLVVLTPAGREALVRALPVWEKTQHRFQEQLGHGRWKELLASLNATVQVAIGKVG
jgi:DNA-binding MarR family transcriptional regulator